MNIRFRVLMPLLAVLLVVLSIAAVLIYVLPATQARLADYVEDRAVARAAAAADAVAGSEGTEMQRELEPLADAGGGEVLVVDRQGTVVARVGESLLSPPPEEILQNAADGKRMNDTVGKQKVAVVPLISGGDLDGGVVFAPGGDESILYQLFLRSGIEAAGIAAVLGGGLALLLANLLSRRIERLNAGALAIERGDLSHRIEPGSDDELGDLARSFNSMATKLQGSFANLEDRVAERTAQLEAEHARLKAVLRQMPSGVVIAEAPSGEILLSNERAEELRRRPLLPYIAAWEQDEYEAFGLDGRPYGPEEFPLARTIRTGEEVRDEEMSIIRGDGSRATVRVNSSPIRGRDGRVVAGVTVFYDITEYKQAEEEIRRLNEDLEQRVRERTAQLEQERATLNAILDNLTEGVLAADAQDRIVFTNPAARSMLKVGKEKPLEKLPDPWEDFDLSEAVVRCAKEEECVEARVSNGEGYYRIQLEHLPKFGDCGGGVLVVMQDLSEGRRLEASQQRFLANAAHELKTPITTILGASELLLTESEDDPEVRNRFLTHIYSEARRMQRLSDTLLRLARTGVDLRDPNLEVVDLGGIVREAAGRMQPFLEKAGLNLREEGRNGRVLADHEWLEQSLLVVLGNAIKHSEPGGEVRLRMEDGVVIVEDEGAGIGEEDLPYVFERFYRGKQDPEKGSEAGGFGLGLSICKELVERMGGSISLESEKGVGTKVRIELRKVDQGAKGTDS